MPQRVIVHATVEYGRAAWGGIASALDLMVGATAQAHEPTVVLTVGPSEGVRLAAPCLRVCTVAAPELGGDSLYRSPRRVELGAVLSRRMADVLTNLLGCEEVDLFVHNEELALLLELAEAHRKVFVTHGLVSQEHPHRPELAAQEHCALSLADTVAALSAAQTRAVRSAYPDLSEIRYLPLPLELLSDQLSPLTTVERQNGLVIAAGRAVAQKGFDILLSAVRHMHIDQPIQIAVYCGHGDEAYNYRCQELAQRAGEFVTVHSWLSRPQLFDRMRHASVICVPSRFEPVGLLAAEAQAMGVPVVASAVGGLTEIVDVVDGGWLVPVGQEPEAGPQPKELLSCLSVAVQYPKRATSGSTWLRQWSVAKYLAAVLELREL